MATEGKISKNARTSGSKTQKFFCPCGGEVRMIGIAKSYKIQMRARCENCGREERSPKYFKTY